MPVAIPETCEHKSTEYRKGADPLPICVQKFKLSEVKICGCAQFASACLFIYQYNMSLAEASEARKARLIALRKRKAGEAVDGHVLIIQVTLPLTHICSATNR